MAAPHAASLAFPLWLEEICIRFRSNDESLTNLNLNIRRLTPASLAYLCDALKNNDQLDVLNLTNALVPPLDMGVCINGLARHASLKVLHLSYNKLNDVTGLASILSINTSLEEIYLNYNRIQDGIVDLAEALKTNGKLRVLHLGKNRIDDKGAESLASMLHVNKSLELLSLVWNNIGPAGLASLVQGLQHNLTLRVLEVDQNPGCDPKLVRRIRQLGLSNSYGRHLLQYQDLPLGLWGNILAARPKDLSNRIFFFLQAKPDLCSHGGTGTCM